MVTHLITLNVTPEYHQKMRTTLTLDDDVAVKAAAKHRPFRVVVNDALRGLGALERRAPARKPFRTRGFDLGPSLVGSLDNVEDALSGVDGEHRP